VAEVFLDALTYEKSFINRIDEALVGIDVEEWPLQGATPAKKV
jgi:hypothetical protein